MCNSKKRVVSVIPLSCNYLTMILYNQNLLCIKNYQSKLLILNLFIWWMHTSKLSNQALLKAFWKPKEWLTASDNFLPSTKVTQGDREWQNEKNIAARQYGIIKVSLQQLAEGLMKTIKCSQTWSTLEIKIQILTSLLLISLLLAGAVTEGSLVCPSGIANRITGESRPVYLLQTVCITNRHHHCIWWRGFC